MLFNNIKFKYIMKDYFTNKDYNLIIGRHCLLKNPSFLSGSVDEAVSYGSNSLMIYLGAPQNSFRQPISNLKIPEFKKKLIESSIDLKNVIVHGSYLINLSNINDDKVFNWSVKFLKEEISRMEEIGIDTIVIHPGSSIKKDKINESLVKLSEGLNKVLIEKNKIRIALETSCKNGTKVGWNFYQLRDVIERIDYKYREKIGICWDTCHLYASNYDIKKELDKIIEEFSRIIGIEKLWVIHINDSLFDLGENKDRHENIGYGKIGFEPIKKIIWHPKLNGIIKILETPRKNFFSEEIRKLKEF